MKTRNTGTKNAVNRSDCTARRDPAKESFWQRAVREQLSRTEFWTYFLPN